MVLEILRKGGNETELLLSKFRAKVQKLCKNSKVDDCHNSLYTRILDRLIISYDNEMTSGFIDEWQNWAKQNSNLRGIAFSKYYTGHLNRNLDDQQSFISDLLTAQKMFVEINPEQRIIYEIDNNLASYYRDIGAVSYTHLRAHETLR